MVGRLIRARRIHPRDDARRPARGGRHGDPGLTIGREGMQPVFDFIDMAQAAADAVFRLVRADDAALAAQPARAIAGELPRQGPVARDRQVLGDVRVVRRDLRAVARPPREPEARRRHAGRSSWPTTAGSRIRSADRYAPRSKQSPYEGGLRTPIMVRWPGKVAAADIGHARELDRHRPDDPQAAGVACKPAPIGVNLLDQKAVRRPPGGFRRDLHPQRGRHRRAELEPPIPLGRRGRLEADRAAIGAMSLTGSRAIRPGT